MKIGDLVEWAGFYGVVTRFIDDTTLGQVLEVHWIDGGVSVMYEDELTRCEHDIN